MSDTSAWARYWIHTVEHHTPAETKSIGRSAASRDNDVTGLIQLGRQIQRPSYLARAAIVGGATLIPLALASGLLSH
jgi:hypothetical protein